MIYYAIQNKDTKEYWRGKGSTNHWGKYFNQASIYRIRGQAEHTVQEINWQDHTTNVEIVTLQITVIS